MSWKRWFRKPRPRSDRSREDGASILVSEVRSGAPRFSVFVDKDCTPRVYAGGDIEIDFHGSTGRVTLGMDPQDRTWPPKIEALAAQFRAAADEWDEVMTSRSNY